LFTGIESMADQIDLDQFTGEQRPHSALNYMTLLQFSSDLLLPPPQTAQRYRNDST